VIFVIGLAGFLNWLAKQWGEKRAMIPAAALVGLFIAWNVGLMFQCATRMINHSFPIYLKDAAYNQVAVVPKVAGELVVKYKWGVLHHVRLSKAEGATPARTQP
jgi:hypothetical protein